LANENSLDIDTFLMSMVICNDLMKLLIELNQGNRLDLIIIA